MGRVLKGVGYFFGAAVVISVLSQCGSDAKKDTGTGGYSGLTSTPVQEPQKVVDAATINDALKGLSKECDKMRDICWYKAVGSPKFRNTNAFYLYFGRTSSGAFTDLRLTVQYFADDWLFINGAWAKADGDRVDVPSAKWERDNNHNIWEWTDVEIDTPRSTSAITKIANAKNVVVRFEGKQYYNDKTLSAAQLKAMRDVIAAYEKATGKTIN